MKKGKHTEEQIIGVLKQVEAGRTVKEVARELGLVHFVHDRNYGYGRNQQTCYREALAEGADQKAGDGSCSLGPSPSVRRWQGGCLLHA